MKRRTFLQRIGSILAVLGVTEAQWLALCDRYSQALAQPSQRKLALLIGINQYQKSPALGGCLTDVELQKELLIHRFGFLSSDILTLTAEKATRKSIEEAFLAHLGQQVKAGDVAVFHFSGYGTRIKSGRFIDTVQNALVPAHLHQDAQKDGIVNYILEETLRLLLRSLPTDKVTAVLDTSYYAPSKIQPTGWRIRVRPESAEAQLAIEELEFLQQLRTQNSNPNHAVVLSATSDTQQLAREILFSGFSAGLFTYALTQYLWETTPATTIQFSLSHVGSYMHQLGSNQQPGLFSDQKDQPKALTVENLLLPNRTDGAEGVIRLIEDDGRTAQVFLAGLPPQVLENYGVNSRFTLLTGEQLTLRSRTGLTAKAQISKNKAESPLRGQLFQEAVRVLPRNINLIVALDTGLERIERVDATSAFAAIDHISTVIAGEQPADCVFGKLSETPSRYGLFTPGGQLIPNTSGEPGEAVKLVVQRLVPKLPTLLAAKLWRLTENEGSSRLPVKATLEIINNLSPRIVMQRETTRTLSIEQLQNKSLLTPLNNATVPIGSRMQYRLLNQSDRQVYLMLLGLKNNRDAIAFYPWQSPEETTFLNSKPLFQQVVIAPGETLLLPKSVTASEWMIPGPAYECEHQLIFSSAPFKETLAYLEKSKYPITDQRPFGALLKPLEIVQALLQDLHNASAVKSEVSGISTDSYVLDVKTWASFNFDFQVA